MTQANWAARAICHGCFVYRWTVTKQFGFCFETNVDFEANNRQKSLRHSGLKSTLAEESLSSKTGLTCSLEFEVHRHHQMGQKRNGDQERDRIDYLKRAGCDLG